MFNRNLKNKIKTIEEQLLTLSQNLISTQRQLLTLIDKIEKENKPKNEQVDYSALAKIFNNKKAKSQKLKKSNRLPIYENNKEIIDRCFALDVGQSYIFKKSNWKSNSQPSQYFFRFKDKKFTSRIIKGEYYYITRIK